MIYIYFLLYLFFFKKFLYFLRLLKRDNVYFFSLTAFYFSLFIFLFVILIFLLLYRILKFFLKKNVIFDLKIFFPYFGLNFLILILFLFFSFRLFRKLVVFFIKKHYLKLHYYFFLRFYFYQVFNFKLQKIYLYKLNEKYFFIFFFFDHFFKFLLAFFLIKNIFFDNFVVDLTYLPLYGLYYLILNFLKFIACLNDEVEKIALSYYYSYFIKLSNSNLYNLYYYFNNVIYNENNNYYFILINKELIFSIASREKPKFFPPRVFLKI